MKTIKVAIKKVGCNEFISDSSIKILIDGKEVENNIHKIVWEALEVFPNFEKYITNYYCGVFGIDLQSTNGNIKSFEIKISKWCDVDKWDEEEIIEYFNRIKEFIEEIEKWMRENSSCTREFSFEI